jgi:hypothetical protein
VYEGILVQIHQIIAEIEAEINCLQQARTLLSGSANGAARSTPKKRTLSADARARIAAAQKVRWAKAKKASK